VKHVDIATPVSGGSRLVARVDGVIIDLDGTLVDSVPDLAIAANLMLDELGHDAREESEIRRYVGNGVPRLVHRALTGEIDGEADAALFERAHGVFLRHYAEHLSDRSRCFPGVEDGLVRLAASGARLACVTNKPAEFTRPLLEHLGIADFFQALVCGDTLAEKKPHPAPVLHAAAGLGVNIADCVMIGDSASDIKAAHAAGCICVCVNYGYNQGIDLSALSPAFLADDFTAAVDRILTTS
jgi:phosphoglycolate phosphatase